MRLQVVSDLHLDVCANPMPSPVAGVDAVVVAGDTAAGVAKSFAFARAAFPRPLPLVIVLGNREFHGRHLVQERRLARSLALLHDIVLLDDAMACVAGMTFIGTTLWTDYLLDGAPSQPDAMSEAAGSIEDHARISILPEPWIRFKPYDALAQHHAGRRFLTRSLAERHPGPTVVVTHHAPSRQSLVGRRGRHDACFASDLDALVASSGAAVWIHGHTHAPCDYMLGGTRVLANPRGRSSSAMGFDPCLTVEVQRSSGLPVRRPEVVAHP